MTTIVKNNNQVIACFILKEMKKIKNQICFFVSVIRPLDTQPTSTDIMTATILDGLKQTGIYTVFFAISQIPSEFEKIEKYYRNRADLVIVLPSHLGYKNSTYKLFEKLYFNTFCDYFYRKDINKYLETFQLKPDIIISHSPSLDSIFYSNQLKKIYKQAKWFQYWSDPIALTGITPDKLGIKRIPYRYIEKKALENADIIIYGTKTLMIFQKKIYSHLSEKMTYIDIPYVETTNYDFELQLNTVLYAGNYYKNIRNINPLIKAIEKIGEFKLDIYGSGDVDLDVHELQHTRIHNRVSADEINKLASKYEYLVCILNHSCIQIPGKIFYDIAKDVKIIIIADGKYKDFICDYLKEYNRFIICDNTEEDIISKLQVSINQTIDFRYIDEHYSPRAVAEKLLNGGIEIN